jgi:hypothetical protein
MPQKKGPAGPEKERKLYERVRKEAAKEDGKYGDLAASIAGRILEDAKREDTTDRSADSSPDPIRTHPGKTIEGKPPRSPRSPVRQQRRTG